MRREEASTMNFTTSEAEQQQIHDFLLLEGFDPEIVIRFFTDFMMMVATHVTRSAVCDMVLLDGNIAAVSKTPDPVTNLRAFIDRYIEQGEELKSAKAILTRVTTADSVDDLFSAKTECLTWLDTYPVKKLVRFINEAGEVEEQTFEE